MRLRSFVSFVSFALFVAACGSASPHEPTVVAAPPTEGRWPAPVAAIDGPWRATEFLAYGHAQIVGTEADGTRLVLDLGRRLALTDTAISAADDGTLLEMLAAARVGDDWVFAYERGAILRADGGFLGPLSVALSTPTRILAAEAGEGALVLWLVDRTMWIYDASGLRELRVSSDAATPYPPGAVLAVELVSATHLAVIVAPGVMMVSTDGRTFAPVDLGGRVAFGLARRDDGSYLVHTLDGWMATDGAPATVVDAPGDASILHGTFPREPTADEAHRLDEESAMRQPYDVPAVPGAHGRIVRWMEPDGAITAWSAERGLVRLAVPTAGTCRWYGFGDALLAACGNDPTRVFVSDDQETLQSMGELWLVDDLHFSADGSSFGGLGTCRARTESQPKGDEDDSDSTQDESEYEDEYEDELEESDNDAAERPLTLCWHDGTRLVETTLPPDAELHALYRGHALISWNDLAREGRRIGVLDLARGGAPTELALSPSLAVDPRDLDITADGTVHGVVEDDGRLALLVAELDGSTAVRLLPDGTRTADLADRAHGLLVGAHFSDVQVTSDGGATWAPLPLDWQGEAASYTASEQPVYCGAGGCRVGFALFFGPEGLAPVREPGHTARVLWPPDRSDARGRSDSWPVARWACEAGTHPTTARAPGGGWGYATVDAQRVVHVRGVDARGTYESHASLASLGDDWSPLGGSRALVIAYDDRSVPTSLACATSGHAFTALALPSFAEADDRFGQTGFATLARVQGGVIVRQERGGEPGLGLDVVVAFERDGQASTPRAFVWPPRARHRMTAELASGEPGVAAVLDDAIVFHGLRGTSQRLGSMPATLAPCGAGEVVARMSSYGGEPIAVDGLTWGYDPATTVLAVVDRVACIELVGSADEDAGTELVVAADHGAMHGAVVARAGRSSEETCRPEPSEE